MRLTGASARVSLSHISKTSAGAVVLAILTAHCSSSTSTALTNKADDAGTPMQESSTCMAPAAAETLDAGYGCKQGATSQTDCSASEYELACLGTDGGAAAPSASLGCSLEDIPGQIENRVAYCCPCQ
jgi:hypothetical protein